MNRYIIGSLWDRENRNGANANFEYLFEGRRKIDELNNRADNILNEAKQTNDMNADVQQQIDNVVSGVADADSEVAQARGSHSVLNGRLQEFDTSIYNDGTNASIFGAMGDGVTDDTLALQTAIDESRGNALHLKAKADYIISDTLVLHEDSKIIGNDARLILNAKVDGVMIPINAIVEGVNFQSGITGYDKFFIRLDDKSGFSVARTGYVKDISFRGDEEHLSKGIGAYDEGEHGVVTYFNASNLTFNKMYAGVYFKTTHTSSWYNGNIFDGVRMYDCVHFITLDGICDGNNFKRVQIQPSSRTITGVKCSGHNNKFDVTSWDYNHYPDAVKYDFSNGFFNEIETNESVYNISKVKGMNSSNRYNSHGASGVVYPKVNTESSYVTNRTGSPVSSYQNYMGNQDDIFTMADKTSTVTSTGNVTGNLSNLFRMNRTYVDCTMLAGDEATIEMTKNEGNYNYIGWFGVLFTSRMPDWVIFEYETSTGGKYSVDFTDVSDIAVYTNEITHASVKTIRIKFGVENDKNVRMSRIFGSSSYSPQTSFLQTDGGDMYGNLTFKERGPILTSNDGSTFRLNVGNDGTLSTVKLS